MLFRSTSSATDAATLGAGATAGAATGERLSENFSDDLFVVFSNLPFARTASGSKSSSHFRP